MENKFNESIEDLDNWLLNRYLYVERVHEPANDTTSPLTDEEFSKAITELYLYGSKDPEDTDWIIPPGNYSAIAKHLNASRYNVTKYIKNYSTELIELGFKIPNIKTKHQKITK